MTNEIEFPTFKGKKLRTKLGEVCLSISDAITSTMAKFKVDPEKEADALLARVAAAEAAK